MIAWLIGGCFTVGVMAKGEGASNRCFADALVGFVIWPAVLGGFVGETVRELLKEKNG